MRELFEQFHLGYTNASMDGFNASLTWNGK